MRHAKHSNQLGRKKEHRIALMANMAMALIKNRRIRTTLAKAKALRPFIEKVITLAKKAHATDDKLKKQHFHSLALSRVRDLGSVNRLFNDLVEDFTNRAGGYTRIYKLVPRRGDAADMAIIELIASDDEGYGKRKAKSKKSAKAESPADETSDAAESSPEETLSQDSADAESSAEESSASEGDSSEDQEDTSDPEDSPDSTEPENTDEAQPEEATSSEEDNSSEK